MKTLHLGKLHLSAGWFSGEDAALFRLAILHTETEYHGNVVGITIFAIFVVQFGIEIYLELK